MYLYSVSTQKDVLLTVRISDKTRDEFKLAADLRGASMSGLLHQFIVRTIREEKEREPSAFNQRPPGIPMRKITVSTPDKLRKLGKG